MSSQSIYNFARKENTTITNPGGSATGQKIFSPEPETGNYESTPYTRYMSFCGIYQPVATTIVYIVLNKYWFLQIRTLAYQKPAKNFRCNRKTGRKFFTNISTSSVYLRVSIKVQVVAFLKDPLAYVAVVFLVSPFILKRLQMFNQQRVQEMLRWV